MPIALLIRFILVIRVLSSLAISPPSEMSAKGKSYSIKRRVICVPVGMEGWWVGVLVGGKKNTDCSDVAD